MVFFILPSLSAQDLDIGPEGISLRDDISRGLMTRAIWKRPCINLFITYFARADNMLLPRRQITRHNLCFYYTCKFGVISIKYVIIKFIGNLDIFLFDLTDWYCQYQLSDTNTGKYQSVWRLIPKKKPNNICFEGLDRYYHSSSYWTHCHTSDNVCLDLKKGCYSIFIAYMPEKN